MGLGRNRNPCLTAPTCDHGSISVWRGNHAISGEKIPVRARSRANYQVHTSSLPDGPLWTADPALISQHGIQAYSLLPVWLPRAAVLFVIFAGKRQERPLGLVPVKDLAFGLGRS
jgi:hypothetical protein